MRRLVRAQRFGASDGLRPLKHGRISRILVAVDANDTADGAAKLAISLVRRNYNAELAFCHVINTQRMAACVDRSGDDYGLSFELAREAALAVLERCCLFARNAGLFARSYVRFGNPVAEIQSFARGRGAELIVIGNRPAEKAHRLLNGSVRDEMVRTCPLPLLVAPETTRQETDFNPRCIVVAGADSPRASGAKRLAADLAADYLSQLILLPGSTGGAVEEKKNIDGAIREHIPGLIVMACTRRRRFHNIFVDDIAERVMQDALVPLLVVSADELNETGAR
jgi:nucleotide-binding universal stress UspA family protein